MRTFNTTNIPMTDRIKKLKEELYRKMPEIEVDRAVLITESYQQTEQLPTVKRRALAFEHILHNIPITIRDNELIVGSLLLHSRLQLTHSLVRFVSLEYTQVLLKRVHMY